MKYHVREARHSDIAKLTELRVRQLEERVTELKPDVALSTMRHLTDELGNRVRALVLTAGSIARTTRWLTTGWAPGRPL